MITSTAAGYVLSLSVILLVILGIACFPKQVFGIFTNDPHVIDAITALLFYLLLDVFIDALPLNITGSLNGRSDVKIPTINQLVAFLGIRISACYLLAFTYGLGLKGLILGLAAGGASSLLLNGARFFYLVRRDKLYGVK